MWRDGHWNCWMFEIDEYLLMPVNILIHLLIVIRYSPNNNTIGWHYGGFQGSRASNVGSEWYFYFV